MGGLVSLLSSWRNEAQSKNLECADGADTIMVRSFSFNGREVETTLRSVSFKKTDTEAMLASGGSGQVVIERSPSFKSWEPDVLTHETTVSFRHQHLGNEKMGGSISSKIPHNYASLTVKPTRCVSDLISPRPPGELDAAAVKVQKVYKSYRTRRNLADCAVVVEELWWKALDFAALKRSSVSYYRIERSETAVSRWARARTRAAKVGKGLSKDEKAQKLALQHWLEAIDPRHRYGHNLHLYYDVWFESESSQPFFYWLDIGDGKEVNVDKCPRNVLQRQCIKYLGPKEREAYEVIVEEGKLIFRKNRALVNTYEGSKWIFVLSTSRTLYVGQKKKGVFQHSSFLAGGATTSAGRLVAQSGVLKAIWPYSGHYLPTEDNFKEFVSFLQEHHVDLTHVKRYAIDDDGPVSIVGNEQPHPRESFTSSKEAVSISTMEKPAHMEDEFLIDEEDKSKDAVVDLGRPMSCKWATGAGPRIGCVRDYPTDMQCMALEKVNLSPRITPSLNENNIPIPSPRPGPTVRLSPRLAYMGIPSPRLASLHAV